MSKMPFLMVVIAILSTVLQLLSPSNALADDKVTPVSPDQMDIVGVKLGMSLEQVKAALHTFNPNLHFVQKYLIDDGNVLFEFDDYKDYAPVHNSKLKIPVELYAADPEIGIALKSNVLSNNPNEPLRMLVGGEWFTISFSPDSGKVIAIIRYKSYGAWSDDDIVQLKQIGVGSPRISDLEGAIKEKYSIYSSINYSTLGYAEMDSHKSEIALYRIVFDARGRLLHEKHPDFNRCVSYVRVVRTQAFKSRDGHSLQDVKGVWDVTDWWKKDWNSRIVASTLLDDVLGSAPQLWSGVNDSWSGTSLAGRGKNGRFKDCGVELKTVLYGKSTQDKNGYVSYMTTSLADLSAVFNGVDYAAFAKSQAAAVVPDVAVKKEKF